MNRLTVAERLLQSLGITDPKDIDLEAIAWHQGAEVRVEPLDGCEARIIGNSHKAIITVSESNRFERRRFSIGHELGHWKFHRGQAFICRSDDIGSQKRNRPANDPEKVADDYAVELLMPSYLFKKEADASSSTSFEAVLDIKDSFRTSLTATALRFVDYCPETSILACYDKRGLKWHKRGKDVPSQLYLKKKLDQDSYAFDVLCGQDPCGFPTVIGADSWFDNPGAEDFDVYEDSIRIYDGMILTFISWRDEEMLETYET